MIYKKAALKNFAIFTGKHLCWSFFIIKLQAFSTTILLERDSNTAGVFLWILRNFKDNLFWRTSANDCFWEFMRVWGSLKENRFKHNPIIAFKRNKNSKNYQQQLNWKHKCYNLNKNFCNRTLARSK